MLYFIQNSKLTVLTFFVKNVIILLDKVKKVSDVKWQ